MKCQTKERLLPGPVVVLMSTYNGERFIEEQVRSILEQLPQYGCLLVRDDGSRDRTVDLIRSLGDERVKVICGVNIGFAKSFLTLLQQAPTDAEMVMFSDQDDVWFPHKIERAWSRLQAVPSGPALYCSAQMLADESLNPLEATPPWPRPPSFVGALAENIVTGCTAALNPEAAKLLREGGVPAQVHFHDWWMYLVIAAFGTVVVDDEPTLLYRQHGGNLIGRGAGWWGRHLQILRFLLKNDWVGIMLGQVAELQSLYGGRMSPEQRWILSRHFDVRDNLAKPKWRTVLGWTRWRQTWANEVFFRMLLMTKRSGIWPPFWRRPE